MLRRVALFFLCFTFVFSLGACTTRPKNPPASFSEGVYEKNFVIIKYPIFDMLSNAAFTERFNKLICELALGDADALSATDTYELSYEVCENSPELISILFSGYSDIVGTAYPSTFSKTLNIDPTRGQLLRLSDFADSGELADKIISGKGFSIISASAESSVLEYLRGFSSGEMQELLDGVDSSSEGSEPPGYSYIKHGRLHVCINVPHALGDYIDLEFE